MHSKGNTKYKFDIKTIELHYEGNDWETAKAEYLKNNQVVRVDDDNKIIYIKEK